MIVRKLNAIEIIDRFQNKLSSLVIARQKYFRKCFFVEIDNVFFFVIYKKP